MERLKEYFAKYLIVVFIVAVFGLMLFFVKQSCLRGYENYEPQWGIISGCRIMSEGKLTPVDIVRELQ